jgi:hypothetical protein
MADLTPCLTREMSADTPWPLAELVRAQCMACEGNSFDAIAQALGRSMEEVRRRLDPEPAPHRPKFTSVGYQHLKRR